MADQIPAGSGRQTQLWVHRAPITCPGVTADPEHRVPPFSASRVLSDLNSCVNHPRIPGTASPKWRGVELDGL